MRVDLGELYNQTVTVVNRLDARDTPLRQDVYYATVLDGCMWSQKQVRTVQDDGTVVLGVTHVVQVPESDRFLPYNDWASETKVAPVGVDGDEGGTPFVPPFTARLGDYVFKGEVEEPVDATALKKLVSRHEPDVFQIQSFRDLTHGPGMSHGTSGIMRFAECYVLEG